MVSATSGRAIGKRQKEKGKRKKEQDKPVTFTFFLLPFVDGGRRT
jgi:hypothetical protein